ncbi:MAG: hypothetical protein GWP70_13920 [Proteobacteria bacterium]|nr:hypothetical protein [Pseudomonadota bacterium]
MLNAEQDQPTLSAEELVFQGTTHQHRANLHDVWLTQRSQRFFQQLPSADQQAIESRLAAPMIGELLNTPADWVIQRRDNRLTIE